MIKFTTAFPSSLPAALLITIILRLFVNDGSFQRLHRDRQTETDRERDNETLNDTEDIAVQRISFVLCTTPFGASALYFLVRKIMNSTDRFKIRYSLTCFIFFRGEDLPFICPSAVSTLENR